LGRVIGIAKRRGSDGLNDGDQIFRPMHDFPYQHLLPFFSLLAPGNVLPADHHPADLTLIVPPGSDITFHPERSSIG